ncbi:hypothetical protein [Streptomyces sp. HUAS TT20]|uniref:hypothetical protein n=1 Tax=Streptomyces sp. HUAS TT20 TaxID=3447509 RepID=UPI0021D955F5|nr:hypothetical protein [Streptomyces sp. HUAS 15-9]UXY26603.1 hypothetical protein N8I87_08455 [Streptomyces sp. HUAS 15-9]
MERPTACRTHELPYPHQACGGGPRLVALDSGHGLENMWPQPLMLMLPEGFTPPLTDAQLAWARAEE